MKPTEGSTVIGKSVTIRGNLSGKEDLYMDGDIEGTINLESSRLTIGPNARVIADVHIRDIIVMGKIKGSVHASGRVEIRHTASVIGDIFASRISIEDDALIHGRVELKTTSLQQSSSPHSGLLSVQEALILEPKA
jgi:cytoskeletal protein CcmA (bactofilin family)